MDRDIVTPSDLFELSQTTFSLGTARSMAMAGAFTSLGADLTSMAINPAGLGMYRRNEISITSLMSFARAENNAPAFNSNSKNRFSIGNFGFTANVYEGSGPLVSVNIGFGYNRLQDLNYQYSYYTQGNVSSIADVFSDMLQYSGINRDQITGGFNWSNFNPRLWGSILGYKAGFTDQIGGKWQPTWIGNNVDIGNYTTVVSNGSIGEYDISAGFNLNNKFYIGATFGIQSLYQRKTYYYGEDYVYPGNGTDPNLDYQLLYSNFNQEVILDGAGVNFKLGMIYRPIQNLRIGFAFHTPTYYWIDRTYQAYTDSGVHVNNPNDPDGLKPGPDGNQYTNALSPVLEDTGGYNWEFTTPARLMFGISYAFGNRGLISVDYERDWYNGMRMKNNPGGGGNEIYNDTFRSWYKGANIVRIGAEFKPLPFLAIRGGFGYMGSMLQDEEQVSAAPMTKQMLYYSAGLGLSLSGRCTGPGLQLFLDRADGLQPLLLRISERHKRQRHLQYQTQAPLRGPEPQLPLLVSHDISQRQNLPYRKSCRFLSGTDRISGQRRKRTDFKNAKRAIGTFDRRGKAAPRSGQIQDLSERSCEFLHKSLILPTNRHTPAPKPVTRFPEVKK